VGTPTTSEKTAPLVEAVTAYGQFFWHFFYVKEGQRGSE
jgi:hypothetical protein